MKMLNNQNNKIRSSIATSIFVLIFIFSVNAQSVSKTAEDLTSKLQQKVLLNENQTDEIKKFLIEYLTASSEDTKKKLESRIESLLDEKQKIKYNILRKDWWESVSKEAVRKPKE